MQTIVYAGFWIRTLAALIDSLLMVLVLGPVVFAVSGLGGLIQAPVIAGVVGLVVNYFAPVAAVILFWIYKSATPGKIVLGMTIVDERTGEPPSVAQFIIRYFGYYICILPLFAGIIWVGIDQRKQGWHDKLAHTLVIRI